MKVQLTFLSLLLSLTGFSQVKSLPASSIEKLSEKHVVCIDSVGKKTPLCSMSLEGFSVEFYKITFNRATKEMQMTGRLSPAFNAVGIYIGTNDSIPLKTPISRTSYDKEYLSNDGFFDVTFVITPTSVLYFYERPYFARQFNLFKLLSSSTQQP